MTISKQAFSTLILLSLIGCSQDISTLSCSDVEDEVVDMSKGQIIKITAARLVSRDKTQILCKGTGVYSDDTESNITYRAYMDEDREIMASYEAE